MYLFYALSNAAKSKYLLIIFGKKTMLAVKFVPILQFCPLLLQKTDFSNDIREIYPQKFIQVMGYWVIWYSWTWYRTQYRQTSNECRHVAGEGNIFTSTKTEETAPLSPYTGKATFNLAEAGSTNSSGAEENRMELWFLVAYRSIRT